MKKLLFLFLLLVNGLSAQHLVLHFDINKTLIASDQGGGKSTEDVINHLLAEDFTSLWEVGQAEPLSYYDYVHRVLVPGPVHDKHLWPERKEYLDRFVVTVNELNYPVKEAVNEEYWKIRAKLHDAKSPVFGSFFALLDYLDDQEISYSLVLRSFGVDLVEVAEEIERVLERPFFDGYATFHQGKLFVEESEIDSPSDICEFFSTGKNLVVQDDWLWWRLHNKSYKFGKPLYLDLEDNEVLQVFFDDNIEGEGSPTDIVTPIDVQRKPLKIEGLIEEGRLVQVDTVQAILDDSYFVDKVKRILSH